MLVGLKRAEDRNIVCFCACVRICVIFIFFFCALFSTFPFCPLTTTTRLWNWICALRLLKGRRYNLYLKDYRLQIDISAFSPAGTVDPVDDEGRGVKSLIFPTPLPLSTLTENNAFALFLYAQQLCP